jgi:hypothetical protein
VDVGIVFFKNITNGKTLNKSAGKCQKGLLVERSQGMKEEGDYNKRKYGKRNS